MRIFDYKISRTIKNTHGNTLCEEIEEGEENEF